MSVFTPIKKVQSKVHHSQYIQNEDKPSDADTTPAEQPANPDPKTPEA
jgi:hypothetical protein